MATAARSWACAPGGPEDVRGREGPASAPAGAASPWRKAAEGTAPSAAGTSSPARQCRRRRASAPAGAAASPPPVVIRALPARWFEAAAGSCRYACKAHHLHCGCRPLLKKASSVTSARRHAHHCPQRVDHLPDRTGEVESLAGDGVEAQLSSFDMASAECHATSRRPAAARRRSRDRCRPSGQRASPLRTVRRCQGAPSAGPAIGAGRKRSGIDHRPKPLPVMLMRCVVGSVSEAVDVGPRSHPPCAGPGSPGAKRARWRHRAAPPRGAWVRSTASPPSRSDRGGGRGRPASPSPKRRTSASMSGSHAASGAVSCPSMPSARPAWQSHCSPPGPPARW